jgi:hypothetical protein
LGAHIRYVTKVNGHNKFRLGGALINKTGLPKYVVLINSDAKTWSVQIKNTIFYREMSRDEIKEEYEEVIDELEDQIEKHITTIDNLKGLIVKLKEDVAKQNKKKN